MLIFTASEIEKVAMGNGMSTAVAGLLGGMGGGIAQAYATMGMFPPLNPFLLYSLTRMFSKVSVHV